MELACYFRITMRDESSAQAEWYSVVEHLDDTFPFLSGYGRKREGRHIWIKLHSESGILNRLSLQAISESFTSKNFEKIETVSESQWWAAPSHPVTL
jgi:hypothetical protein